MSQTDTTPTNLRKKILQKTEGVEQDESLQESNDLLATSKPSSSSTVGSNKGLLFNQLINEQTWTKNHIWVPIQQQQQVKGQQQASISTTSTHHLYEMKEIKESSNKEVVVHLNNNQKLTIPIMDILFTNPPSMNQHLDLLSLNHTNEPSVLHHLRQNCNENFCNVGNYLYLFLGKNKENIGLEAQFCKMIENCKSLQKKKSIILLGDPKSGKSNLLKQLTMKMVNGEDVTKKVQNSLNILQHFTSLKHGGSSRVTTVVNIKKNNSNVKEVEFIPYLPELTRVLQNPFEDQTNPYKVFRFLTKTENDIYGFGKKSEIVMELQNVGISSNQIQSISDVLCGIANLLEFEFEQVEDKCVLKKSCEKYLQKASDRLGLDKNILLQSLIEPIIQINESTKVKSFVSLQEGLLNRDMLVMSIYERLLQYVFNLLKIKLDNNNEQDDEIYSFIDIGSGFESNRSKEGNPLDAKSLNYLETFINNYKNERFLNHFHETICDQSIYLKENIKWKVLEFPHLKGKEEEFTKIFEKLHELSCLSFKADEVHFLKEITDEKSPLITHVDLSKFDFTLNHSCGKIVYQVEKENWFEKNLYCHYALTDKEMLRNSKNEILKEMFQSLVDESNNSNQSGSSKMKITSTIYKKQLDDLINELKQSMNFFICCIKPNVNGCFEKINDTEIVNDRYVLKQLRTYAIFEMIRMIKKIYPCQMTFNDFVKRYEKLITENKKAEFNNQTSAKEKANILLQSRELEENTHYKLGEHYIFLRVPQQVLLEDLLNK
ncbi:hypothetical protein ABK040_014753 [Willaertia magna]